MALLVVGSIRLNGVDELLTVAEIAERLKVNQQTVRNWIDRGELAGLRIGSRRVRIPESELERFIRESSAAQMPSEANARRMFHDALDAAVNAEQPTEEATALRVLAKSATNLARALSR